MNSDDGRSTPRSESGSPASPGPLVGVAAGAALGVSMFLLATLVHERLLSPRGVAPPPVGFADAPDPRAAVLILTGEISLGVEAALVPLREDGAGAGREPGEDVGASLDAALFPKGPRHRWYRLLLTAGHGEEAVPLTLGAGLVRMSVGGEMLESVDLAAAYEAREASLGRHRRLDLRVAGVHRRSVEVPVGGTARLLVALPAEADAVQASFAELAGSRRLWPLEVTVDSLRNLLADGRIGSLEPVLHAEVGSPSRRPATDEDPR